MKINVNNPGREHCAFYAFSIAFIDIIKHEQHRHGYSTTFDKWLQHTPELEDQRKAILSFNFKRKNKALLDSLQVSLREIAYKKQFRQLEEELGKPQHEIIDSLLTNITFLNFDALFREYHRSKRFHAGKLASIDLAEFQEVRQLIINLSSHLTNNNIIVEEQIKAEIVNAFIQDVYSLANPTQMNSNSKILKAIERVKIEEPIWLGSYSDLMLLTKAFAVECQYYYNGNGPDQAPTNLPVVNLNNQYGLHWTTFITTSNAPKNRSTSNYQRFFKDSILTKKEVKQIYLTYTEGFCALVGTRHHMDKAKEIVSLCENENYTLQEIIDVMQTYIQDKSIEFNSDSSFVKRANYILARNAYYNGSQDVVVAAANSNTNLV